MSPRGKSLPNSALWGVWELLNKTLPFFVELLLSRAIAEYKKVGDDSRDPIRVFDRGVADTIAYAALCAHPFVHGWAAARQYRANHTVFFAPNWREIFRQDQERTMPYAAAAAMGDHLRQIYRTLDYDVVDLPLEDPWVRAKFIVKHIADTH